MHPTRQRRLLRQDRNFNGGAARGRRLRAVEECQAGGYRDQILQALKCSGKTVIKRLRAGSTVDLDSVHPRIDLLGAYNFLVKPAGAVREWTFTDKTELLDWTLVEGPWRHNAANGSYEVGPIPKTEWHTVANRPGELSFSIQAA